jgi:hypothetical protein
MEERVEQIEESAQVNLVFASDDTELREAFFRYKEDTLRRTKADTARALLQMALRAEGYLRQTTAQCN